MTVYKVHLYFNFLHFLRLHPSYVLFSSASCSQTSSICFPLRVTMTVIVKKYSWTLSIVRNSKQIETLILIIGLCILLRMYQPIYVETSVRNKPSEDGHQ
jgi:hypothetical protein